MMAVNSLCLVLVFGVGVALSVNDYWCKYTSQQQGQCVLGTTCPSESGSNPYARNLLGCFDESGQQIYTCCVPTSPVTTTTTPPPPPTPTPSSAECGLFSKAGRILLGDPSIRCAWPWLVSIRGRRASLSSLPPTIDDTVTAQLCAGVLIDRQWVITTAFCAMLAGFNADTNIRNNILVVPGEYNITKLEYDGLGVQQEQPRTISNYFIHPQFPLASSTSFTALLTYADKPALNGGNVALLKLAQPVAYTECVKKACLARDLDANPQCGNDECYIAGWGLSGSSVVTEVSYEAAVNLYRQEACGSIARYSGDSTYQARPATMCASPVRNGTAPCVGDNGGMLVCNQRGRWALRGLITKTDFDCEDTKPFIVTDVGSVQQWIDMIIANN